MNKIKKILLAIVLIVLILPSLQNRFNIFKIIPLNGDFMLLDKPEYSKAGWYTGVFQDQYNSWLEENIGFRNFFVRTNNQLDFSLYGLAHAEGVIVGKKNVLYEYDYIRAYLGDDFIGKKTLDKKIRRLKFMQEYLKKERNINLLFVLEPSKARIEPEFMPNSYELDQKTLSNYEYIVTLADKYNITYLDLNHYFLQIKDTISFPLYPQYGVHWSDFSATLVIDTLMRFIEEQTNLNLPEVYIDGIEVSKKLRESDYDGGEALNLLWTLPHSAMPYASYRFEKNPEKDRPHVLAVSDSYYWNIYNTRLPLHVFYEEDFWYFNALVYPEYYDTPTYVEDLEFKTEVEKQNVILLLVTERFLYKYDWRFMDNLYALYFPAAEPEYRYHYENDIRMNQDQFDLLVEDAKNSELSLEEIIYNEAGFLFASENLLKFIEYHGQEYYELLIQNDTNWMKAIKQKALAKGISEDEMLRLDADYSFSIEYPGLYAKYMAIRKNEEIIRNDSNWLGSIKQKAAENYLTVDEMIHQDAVWLYNNQNNPN